MKMAEFHGKKPTERARLLSSQGGPELFTEDYEFKSGAYVWDVAMSHPSLGNAPVGKDAISPDVRFISKTNNHLQQRDKFVLDASVEYTDLVKDGLEERIGIMSQGVESERVQAIQSRLAD